MAHPETGGLGQEWLALQNQYEQYEKGGLLLKLSAVLLCGLGFVLGLHETMMAVLLLILWLQEGIFRTFQTRLGARILRLEQALKSPETSDLAAFQLHTEWLAARPGVLGLLAEYAASALRPTVAFPYALLLLLIGLLVVAAGG
jgi:hypothetical protein